MATLRGNTYVDGDLFVEGVLNVTRVKNEEGNTPYFTLTNNKQDISINKIAILTDNAGGIGYSNLSVASTIHSASSDDNYDKEVSLISDVDTFILKFGKDLNAISINKDVSLTSYIEEYLFTDNIKIHGSTSDTKFSGTFDKGFDIKVSGNDSTINASSVVTITSTANKNNTTTITLGNTNDETNNTSRPVEITTEGMLLNVENKNTFIDSSTIRLQSDDLTWEFV